MFDPRLIRKINQGRCFALVGSGPSIDAGYPSWKQLADGVFGEVKRQGKLSDEPSYLKFLAEGKYPELFRQAEIDFGSRQELVDVVSRLLAPAGGRAGAIYNILLKWPFACFLTTNYDNEIFERLQRAGVFYKTLGNSRTDLAQIRHDATNLIVKFHADFTDPVGIVLTSDDYSKLTVRPEGDYFRSRLRAIFEIFDVCIIGHSLSDPDLGHILELAKQTASPEHPLFLIASDITRAEERELFERFNIAVIPYENPDGRHNRLRRLLSIMDKFITSRDKTPEAKAKPYSADEIEAVQAIIIYRRLVALKSEEALPFQFLGPLVLQALRDVPSGTSETEILKRKPLTLAVSTEAIKESVPGVLAELKQRGLVDYQDEKYALSPDGETRVKDVARQRELEDEQAFGQFVTQVKLRYAELTPVEGREMVGMLRNILVRVFKERGLSIANAVFAGQSIDSDGLSDIFQAISRSAGNLNKPEMLLAFMEAAQLFVIEPNEAQKQYLASLSQGYFLYHLFGLDPSCAKMRREIFNNRIWWCDSSVLIPALAVGSANHPYIADLFGRLRSVRAVTLTTDRLVNEVFEHLEWVVRFVEREPVESPAFLSAALVKGGFKQNLFLDGYIRLAAEGKVGKFKDYLHLVCPGGCSPEAVLDSLRKQNFKIVNVNDLDGYQPTDWGEIVDLAEQIKEVRTKMSIFRSDVQVEAEAEILHVIRNLQTKKYMPPVPEMNLEQSYFLSQSRVLDKVPPVAPVSWPPEALYRYLMALPGEELDPNLLQQCMTQEYYSSGVVLVDKRSYEKFFGPSINAAKVQFNDEKEKYLREAALLPGDVESAFNRTPDLEKPFFVQQMGWRLAHFAEVKAAASEKVASKALAEVEELRLQRDKAWKKKQKIQQRQEQAYLRHQKDPAFQSKRRKQAKRRLKKKKR